MKDTHIRSSQVGDVILAEDVAGGAWYVDGGQFDVILSLFVERFLNYRLFPSAVISFVTEAETPLESSEWAIPKGGAENTQYFVGAEDLEQIIGDIVEAAEIRVVPALKKFNSSRAFECQEPVPPVKPEQNKH